MQLLSVHMTHYTFGQYSTIYSINEYCTWMTYVVTTSFIVFNTILGIYAASKRLLLKWSEILQIFYAKYVRTGNICVFNQRTEFILSRSIFNFKFSHWLTISQHTLLQPKYSKRSDCSCSCRHCLHIQDLSGHTIYRGWSL